MENEEETNDEKPEEQPEEKPEEKPEEPQPEGLKDTDTLPSEANPPAETNQDSSEPKKPKKVLDKLGNEHDPGPPGSSHG